MPFCFLTGELLEALIRLIVAAVLGGIIGFERDVHGRAAGLRTHLLVCLGSALFVIVSQFMLPLASRGDTTRIAAGVVTGIGFLGAGAIIKAGFNVRGLTTAACLWVAAGIGMAAGSGAYAIAISTTVIAMFSLVVLNYLERAYRRVSYSVLTIRGKGQMDISRTMGIVERKELRVISSDCERDYDNDTMTLKLSVRLFHKGTTDKMLRSIASDLESEGLPLKTIKWEHI